MTFEDRIVAELRRTVELIGASEKAWVALERRLNRRRSRRPLRALVAGTIALAVGAASMFLLRAAFWPPSIAGDPRPATPPPLPDVRIGPPDTIPLHTQSVDDVAATADGIWATSLSREDPPVPVLVRLDAVSGRVLDRVNGEVDWLAAGDGAFWGLRGGDSDLLKVDAVTGVQDQIRSGVAAPVVFADGSVWVMQRGQVDGRHLLLRLEPNTGDLQARVPVPAPIWAAAASDRWIWLSPSHPHDESLLRVDTTTNRVIAETQLPATGTVGNMIAQGDQVWLSVFGNLEIWVVAIDASSGAVQARDISSEGTASVIGVSHGRVWFLGERGSLDALNQWTLETDPASDRDWDIWPAFASVRPTATLDPNTGDIWVGNYEGSVTHIPIDEVPSED